VLFRSLLDRATAAVQSAVNRIVGSPPPAENTSVPAPPVEPPAPEKKPHHKKPAPKVPAQASAAAEVPAVATSASIEPAPTPMPVETTTVPVDETVYNPGDVGVVAPVLVRPVLPKEPPPGVPLNQIGTIEVLIDEQGDVEQVKLVSPANRFHERMLVSAAKMWKFRPAFKDGHPVRYRARVRLTV